MGMDMNVATKYTDYVARYTDSACISDHRNHEGWPSNNHVF